MPKHNAENEKIKHRYQVWMQDAKGYSDATIDQTLAAINRFEAHTGLKSFRLFHIEQARAFTRELQVQQNPKNGRPYSRATISGALAALRKFIEWFAGQPEGRNRIKYGDADYFRLSEKNNRIARATRPKRVPTVEEVCRIIKGMPDESDFELRDRAVVAFILLTGARIEAATSALLKHVDIDEGCFHQDARDVKTKRSKTFTTWFVPVGDEIDEILKHWVLHIRTKLLFGPDDPLFPKTALGHDEQHNFVPIGLAREPWSSGATIRRIFTDAFTAAGVPPSNPHAIRDTLTSFGERCCQTPEEFKAFSQNIGHDRVMTTFTSYGAVASGRQAELIRGLRSEGEGVGPVTPQMVKVVLDHLQGQTRQ